MVWSGLYCTKTISLLCFGLSTNTEYAVLIKEAKVSKGATVITKQRFQTLEEVEKLRLI